jgi:glucosyl-dolichyl phosphate glucuronosyltransferase
MLPESIQWEVLVVDNNSVDRTKEVVQEFSRSSPPRFRYLFEQMQGKSYALNTGIRESKGDILAFTDDDVIVDPSWLMNLISPLLGQSEWAGVGGRVLPDRNFCPPPWLPREGGYPLGPLAMFDMGLKSIELAEPPLGNNMAFRKEAFDKHGGFRTDLGPCPGNEIRGEDTEFCQRLLDAGERLGYEPSAVVYHAVSESRLREDYFLAWWFDKARANVRAFGLPPGAKWRVAGIPLVAMRHLAVWAVRWLISSNPSRRFSCKVNVWTTAGKITECWYVSRRPK